MLGKQKVNISSFEKTFNQFGINTTHSDVSACCCLARGSALFLGEYLFFFVKYVRHS